MEEKCSSECLECLTNPHIKDRDHNSDLEDKMAQTFHQVGQNLAKEVQGLVRGVLSKAQVVLILVPMALIKELLLDQDLKIHKDQEIILSPDLNFSQIMCHLQSLKKKVHLSHHNQWSWIQIQKNRVQNLMSQRKSIL